MWGFPGRSTARIEAAVASAQAGAAEQRDGQGKPAADEAATAEPAALRADADLIGLLEADIRRAEARLARAGADMRASAAAGVRDMARIRGDAEEMTAETASAKENAAGLARAIGAFAETTLEIGRQAQVSGRLAGEAEAASRDVSAATQELHGAITQIQAIVALIADIARQTNLLALNASIEAARAGTAGAGFAVVANEVKSLAGQTQKATQDISQKIDRLALAAKASDQAIGRIGTTIAEISPVAARVADAVAGQADTMDQIHRSAEGVERFAETVASRALSISAATGAAAETGAEIERSTGEVADGVREMARHLLSVLRQTAMGDRRRFERWPVEIHGRASFAGSSQGAKTLDLSQGGVLLAALSPAPAVGAPVRLELGGMGLLAGRVAGISTLGCHVAFDDCENAGVKARLAALAAEAAPAIARASAGAEKVRLVLEEALRNRLISQPELFDTQYRPVPGSDPQQVTTASLPLLERLLPAVVEALVEEDRSLAFCVAVDINGYLPVHNARYSRPQRPGDPAWNNANSRNRRIFDDRAGLLAARNTKPYLVQVYARQMGGEVVMMREVDAPIFVAGRHWGAFRTSYKL
ncbi:methyl-accepting chemotaxis protein [Xanthobacter sp. V0B-10]|uniref:methyl-accepting chemotaxis protein n=1 Tax=Xanthobacter albus TaxID=3119929 RepID=UPI0037299950